MARGFLQYGQLRQRVPNDVGRFRFARVTQEEHSFVDGDPEEHRQHQRVVGMERDV